MFIEKKSNKKAQELQGNPEWFSANGWNSADSWAYADDWSHADSSFNQNNGNGRAAPKSQPYIFQIANSCSVAQNNISLGDAFNVLTMGLVGGTGFAFTAAGNLVINGLVTISLVSTISTYAQFLGRMVASPINMGGMLIISKVGTNNQVENTFAIDHYIANDKQVHEVHPTIDPNQQQADRVTEYYGYLFDGATKITWTQINASSTIEVRLYPINEFTPTQIVAGRPALQTFGNPQIEKVAKISLPVAGQPAQ